MTRSQAQTHGLVRVGNVFPAREPLMSSGAEAPAPEKRWAPWQTLLFILVYCSVAWGVIASVVLWLLR